MSPGGGKTEVESHWVRVIEAEFWRRCDQNQVQIWVVSGTKKKKKMGSVLRGKDMNDRNTVGSTWSYEVM